jgi:hypothetical protein
MPAPASFDWLYTTLGYTLAAAGALLLLWSLFHDRPKGRRRCPRCWYDMSGVPSLTCPECGRTARSDRKLLKTRRRWRPAAIAALALLLAYPLAHTPRIRLVGWRGAIPTTGLIWYVTIFEREPSFEPNSYVLRPPSPAAAELSRRCWQGELQQWQWTWLLHRSDLIWAHARWPADRPLEISVGLPMWLGQCQLEADSPLAGGYSVGADHSLAWIVGHPDRSKPSVRLHFRATDGFSFPWQGDWDLPIRVVPTPEDALDPVRNPETDAAVRRALRITVHLIENSESGADLRIESTFSRRAEPLLDRVALGVVAEFLLDGAPAFSRTLDLRISRFDPINTWSGFAHPPPSWAAAHADLSRWSVRIRGVAAEALRDFRRERYWAGEYTAPLTEFLAR